MVMVSQLNRNTVENTVEKVVLTWAGRLRDNGLYSEHALKQERLVSYEAFSTKLWISTEPLPNVHLLTVHYNGNTTNRRNICQWTRQFPLL